MIYNPVILTVTPEQIERKWALLSSYQKDQVAHAKRLGKTLKIEIIDRDGEGKILYDVWVSPDE